MLWKPARSIGFHCKPQSCFSCLQLRRSFTTNNLLQASRTPNPPRTPIPPNDLTISYLKGSGPGGQKINKTSSAVQIKHLPSGMVIKVQETRSRDQNEKIAIRKLQDRLEERELGDESRISKRRELLRKRKASRGKKARRKYRALNGTEQETEVVDEEEEEDNTGEEQDPEDVKHQPGHNATASDLSSIERDRVAAHDDPSRARSYKQSSKDHV